MVVCENSSTVSICNVFDEIQAYICTMQELTSTCTYDNHVHAYGIEQNVHLHR